MSYIVVKAKVDQDKQEILSFWGKNISHSLEEKYKWIYENNPAGASQVWLAKDSRTGECVGMTSLFLRRFKANGNVLVGAIAGDLLIDKGHRSAGAALMLQRAVLSSIKDGTVDFIYGFPNQDAEPIIKRIGYGLLGERVRLVKVLQTAPYFLRLKGGRYWGPSLGFVIDLLGRTFYERENATEAAFRCEEINHFDERFDLFWKDADIPFRFVGERSAEYLEWKFLHTPQSENKIVALFDRDGLHLKGYIVYRRIEDSIEIRDFLFGPNEKGAPVLIRYFLRSARSSGAASIVLALLKNVEVETLFKNFGFAERKDPHRIYIYSSEKMITLFPSMKDSKNWLLLQSDDDM